MIRTLLFPLVTVFLFLCSLSDLSAKTGTITYYPLGLLAKYYSFETEYQFMDHVSVNGEYIYVKDQYYGKKDKSGGDHDIIFLGIGPRYYIWSHNPIGPFIGTYAVTAFQNSEYNGNMYGAQIWAGYRWLYYNTFFVELSLGGFFILKHYIPDKKEPIFMPEIGFGFGVMFGNPSDTKYEKSVYDNPAYQSVTANPDPSKTPFDIGIGLMDRSILCVGISLRAFYDFGGLVVGIDLEGELSPITADRSINGLLGYSFISGGNYFRVYGIGGIGKYVAWNVTGDDAIGRLINAGVGLEYKPVQWFGLSGEYVVAVNNPARKVFLKYPFLGLRIISMFYYSM